jgi:hypothetical protein
MWGFVVKLAKAKLASKIAEKTGEGGSLGANIVSGLMDKAASKAAEAEVNDLDKPAVDTAHVGKVAPAAAAPKEEKSDIEKWAAEPGGMARKKVGQYVGKGIKNAITR